MLRLNLCRRRRLPYQSGDIFNGLSFPTTCFGRCDGYIEDIAYIIGTYLDALNASRTSIREPGTFRVFADVFQKIKFSHIFSITELEDPNDAFDILTGVLMKFLHTPDLSIKGIWDSFNHLVNSTFTSSENETKKISIDQENSMAILPTINKDLLGPSTADVQSQQIILLCRCILVYLLYALSESQYIRIPSQCSPSKDKKPFNISLESLSLLKTIVEESNAHGIFTEVPCILDRLILRESRSVRLCLFDGPQYFYQDRFGNPLLFDYEGDMSSSEAKPIIYVPSTTQLEADFDMVSKLTHQIEAVCSPVCSGSPLLESNTQRFQFHESITIEKSMINEIRHNLEALQQQFLTLQKNDNVLRQLLSPLSDIIETTLPHTPSHTTNDTIACHPYNMSSIIKPIINKQQHTLDKRLRELKDKRFAKRTKRSITSRRNPSGLCGATAKDLPPPRHSRRRLNQANLSVLQHPMNPKYAPLNINQLNSSPLSIPLEITSHPESHSVQDSDIIPCPIDQSSSNTFDNNNEDTTQMSDIPIESAELIPFQTENQIEIFEDSLEDDLLDVFVDHTDSQDVNNYKDNVPNESDLLFSEDPVELTNEICADDNKNKQTQSVISNPKMSTDDYTLTNNTTEYSTDTPIVNNSTTIHSIIPDVHLFSTLDTVCTEKPDDIESSPLTPFPNKNKQHNTLNKALLCHPPQQPSAEMTDDELIQQLENAFYVV